MKNQNLSKRSIALILALAMVTGSVIGGTLAWLTAETQKVKNVFTTSNINITLQEHKYDDKNDKLTEAETTSGVDNYKMIPGWTIPKDPWLTVKGGSEDCWIFIKVEEKGGNVTVESNEYNFDSFIDYKIDPNNWKALEGVTDVYYCYAKDIENDRNIKILGYDDNGEFVNNQVLVKDTVTKEMMDAIEEVSEGKIPTLTFTAYACQYWKDNDTPFEVLEAWNNVKPSETTSETLVNP